jgi:NADH-quinone oxidoreductase subunit F
MLERIESGEATPMDLDIMASVQEHIIGNCLCVLGDAMAMPIGSMIEKFRDEFEAHIEAARKRRGLGGFAGAAMLAPEHAYGEGLAAMGAGAQAPGEHAGAPGTQRGSA